MESLLHGEVTNKTTLSTFQSEYLAMSEACLELISLDKAARNILGKTFYPITIWCDNIAAKENIEKEGSHKLKNFVDPIETIQENLIYGEETGKKKHLGESHKD